MKNIKLEANKIYKIWHERKGLFVARLIEVISAPKEDESDTEFLHMIYDVRAGTDQVGLAVVPGKDKVRESNLRPSLINKIEEVPDGEDWLREIKLPEPPKQKGLIDRILNK